LAFIHIHCPIKGAQSELQETNIATDALARAKGTATVLKTKREGAAAGDPWDLVDLVDLVTGCHRAKI